MRTLLAIAAAAAFVAAPARVASADDCGGHVDTGCDGYHCTMDCWTDPCSVWVDAMKDPHSAVCLPPLPEVT